MFLTENPLRDVEVFVLWWVWGAIDPPQTRSQVNQLLPITRQYLTGHPDRKRVWYANQKHLEHASRTETNTRRGSNHTGDSPSSDHPDQTENDKQFKRSRVVEKFIRIGELRQLERCLKNKSLTS